MVARISVNVILLKQSTTLVRPLFFPYAANFEANFVLHCFLMNSWYLVALFVSVLEPPIPCSELRGTTADSE